MDCGSCGKTDAADAEFRGSCGARLGRSGEEARVPMTGPNEMDKSGRMEPAVQGRFADAVEPQGLRRAGFWVRFCAAAIDAIIVMIAFGAVDAVLFPQDPLPFDPDYSQSSFDLVWFIFNLLYYSVGVSVWSTTIGKRALGLYVLRSDGSQVGFLRAVGRWLSYILSALILFIGFFMIGLRQDKRGLHDLICDTVVVSSPGGRP